MDYEQIIANLQQVMLNQSKMLLECQVRIKDLENIIGINKPVSDEVVFGYVDTKEDDRIIHADLICNKNTETISLNINLNNKFIIYISQLSHLKSLKNLEIQFEKGFNNTKQKTTIILLDDLQTEIKISAATFKDFCAKNNIYVSFYDKNKGFTPKWEKIFT
jgi:hypothetical protein